MKLWKIALFAVLAIASSCSIQPKPKLHVTHVIAVTHEGDTLKLPIDVIRPINNYRIINYSGYGGWGYSPYYNYGWNYNMITVKEALVDQVIIAKIATTTISLYQRDRTINRPLHLV